MSIRVLILAAFCVAAVTAAATTASRPKACRVGDTYKKDCNTCTCAANAKDDKCSSFDCSRIGSSTTARTPSNTRPGTCPTVVTPAPGSKICENRDNESSCTNDKDCPGAKKCCVDGCKKRLCRNPIYNYSR